MKYIKVVERIPIVWSKPDDKSRRIAHCSKQILLTNKRVLRKNLGKPAIMYFRERNMNFAKLVTIHKLFSHFVEVRYKCYNCLGKHICDQSTCVKYTDLMTGDFGFKYLD